MSTPTTNPIQNGYAAVSDQVLAGLDRETELARGLPNEAFTGEAFLDLERKHLFARSWTFAGPASDVPNRGDVAPVEVAGRSLFLVRDADDEVRVFHNVCPHRGARLVTEPLQGTPGLTCPYHAWSYGLDGNLKGRPHYHGPEKHDRPNGSNDRVCLFEARSARWHDWVFVNLDGQAPAFDDWIAPAARRYDEAFQLAAFRRAHHASFEFHCNWKLAVENFCDNYHVFKIHPALHALQDPTDRHPMYPDGQHMFSKFTIGAPGRGITVDPDGPMLPALSGLTPELESNSPFLNLFPNTTMAIFPSNIAFVMFEPVRPDHCIMHMWFYFVGDAAQSEQHQTAREKTYEDWTNLNAEDGGICQRLQQGRSCDDYDGGRLSPYWDTGTIHFHRQVAHAVRGLGDFARPAAG